MDLIVSLDQAAAQDPSLTGGKGAALAKLAGSGFPVPPGMCVTIPAYRRFLNQAGLKERILREVKRKDPGDTRWEEMWDASLRIRNLFLTASMSPGLEGELTDTLKTAFGATPVAVRSSSAAEDASRTSFAGLHESFLNVSGHESILRHVRLVWASLWSDGALLYQEELGLDVEADAMAVVIQPLISGESSGVAFGVDPTDRSRGVIEAVYGLNKGLVDGDVEPDRWLIGRDDGMIRDHYQPVRDRRATLTAGGVTISPLVGDGKAAPLTEAQVSQVWSAVVKCEQLFGSPQDVEWTFAGNTLTILQSRPITTTADEPAQRGSKAWNLGLKGSLHRLKELRERIEQVHFPAMEREAGDLARVDLSALDDEALADELMQRTGIFRKWSDIYWDEFIPMAHGVRLFGQVYNDVMGPDDPFEFVKLFHRAPLISTQRNAALMELASEIRKDPALASSLEKGAIPEGHPGFTRLLDLFLEEYGDLSWGEHRLADDREGLFRLLATLAASSRSAGRVEVNGALVDRLAQEFTAAYPGGPEEAGELLELARASWRMRDDDNIFLGRIKGQLLTAVREARGRLEEGKGEGTNHPALEKVAWILDDPGGEGKGSGMKPPDSELDRVRPRQILGQPAAAGTARGLARIVSGLGDLSSFRAGEVLVCDAIDPNMTVLIPVAAAVVERRGGMLIHGAIIAREYGIPCVTGIPDVTRLIHTGDEVTVDGHLGIVIVHKRSGVQGEDRRK